MTPAAASPRRAAIALSDLLTLAALLLLTALLALAATTARADEAPAAWTLSAGGDVGQDSSHGFSAAADYDSGGERFGAGLAASRSTAPATPSSLASVDSTVLDGHLSARIGTARLELGYASTDDQDLRHSNEASAALSAGGDGLHARASVSRRRTDFDGFPVNANVTLRNGQTLTLSGRVGCTMDDTGYGLQVGWTGEAWDLYASGRWWSFDELACTYTSAVPAELRRLDTARFAQLAAARSARLTQRVGGRIGQDSALLDSLYGAGLAHHWETVGLALDWTRSQAIFGDTVQTGWSLTGSWSYTERASVDLTLGTTVQDSDAAPYAGVQFAWRL